MRDAQNRGCPSAVHPWKQKLPEFVDAAPGMLETQFHEQGHCIT